MNLTMKLQEIGRKYDDSELDIKIGIDHRSNLLLVNFYGPRNPPNEESVFAKRKAEQLLWELMSWLRSNFTLEDYDIQIPGYNRNGVATYASLFVVCDEFLEKEN